jgi:peptide-methionine (S)-S-oxide reductase
MPQIHKAHRTTAVRKISLPILAFSSVIAPLLLLAAANGAGFRLMNMPAAHAAEGIQIAPPKQIIAEAMTTQTAIFAGGCFWGIEGVFDHVKGVIRAESGYAGGTKTSADYDIVSSGRTGHAEAVRVVYNPKIISYDQLMQIFFSVALDPTQLNRQGPDSGTQYRNAIFPVTKAQANAARAYLDQLSANSPWGKKPVTKIESGTFYPAEAYHQNFMARNPDHGYIRAYDAPKVANLRRLFPAQYR